MRHTVAAHFGPKENNDIVDVQIKYQNQQCVTEENFKCIEEQFQQSDVHRYSSYTESKFYYNRKVNINDRTFHSSFSHNSQTSQTHSQWRS